MCIVRQSGAGVSLGNTICSARAISKCPLVVTPCVVVGISSSPFCPGSPRIFPGASVPVAGQSLLCQPALTHWRFPPRFTARFCSRILSVSLIPSLLQAGTALELSTWPRLLPTCQLIRPARPHPAAELPRLRMLGHCHGPCPSPPAFVFQPI